jgi:hypothetical protein
MKFKFFLIAIILFLPNELFPLSDSVVTGSTSNNTILGHYSKAKLVTNSYNKINANDVSLFKDSVVFQDRITNKYQSIPLNEIVLINASVGSYWLTGLLLGGVEGLTLPFLFTINNYDVSPQTYLISTIIGSVLGCIIGSTLDDYKTVFQTGDFFVSIQNNNKSSDPYRYNSNITLINFNYYLIR